LFDVDKVETANTAWQLIMFMLSYR
jgi:hypothetical protein